MKLLAKHRRRRSRTPRIAISEAEIAADLLYPARQRAPAPPARRSARR